MGTSSSHGRRFFEWMGTLWDDKDDDLFDEFDEYDEFVEETGRKRWKFPFIEEETDRVRTLINKMDKDRIIAWMNRRRNIVFLAAVLCLLNLLMLYADSLIAGEDAAYYMEHFIKENVFHCLLGFVLMYVISCRFRKCSSNAALYLGAVLIFFSLWLFLPDSSFIYGYPYRGILRIWRFTIPVRDTTILGYILLASWLIVKEGDRVKRLKKLWILFLFAGAVMSVRHNVAAAAVILLCCLVFTAVWAGGKRFALLVFWTSFVSAGAVVIWAVRFYDRNRDSFTNLSLHVQRISAWALPSARQQNRLAGAVDAIWKESGFFRGSIGLLKELLPEMTFAGSDLNGLYTASMFGRGIFVFMLLLELALLGLVLNRFRLFFSKGDTMMSVICLGIFLKLTAYMVFHFGYCFQILPFFSASLPLVSGAGIYQLMTLAELGLVMRQGPARNEEELEDELEDELEEEWEEESEDNLEWLKHP